MTFLTLDLTTKKWLLLFLLCLLFWWCVFAPGTVSAGNVPKTYTITEQELVMLENNLARLSAINNQLQKESKTQNTQALELQKQVQLLQTQLNTLRQESMKQEQLLIQANKSLEQFATEAKQTRLRIKAQRNAWIGATVIAAIVAACHR